MRSDFERFDANASVRRGTGDSGGLSASREPALAAPRRLRLGRRGLSMTAGLGLALVALGGYRATLSTQAADPVRPTISIDNLVHEAGDVPMSGTFDPH